MAQPAPDETTSLLNRLAQKPGVKSTLILSRSTGAVVRASGLESASESEEPVINGMSEVARPATIEDLTSTTTSTLQRDANGDTRVSEGKHEGMKSAENMARLVWRFFGNAQGVTDEMMGDEDGVRLLRLRTRRNEIVIVPDSKFLLVVIHDTPAA